MLITGLVLHMRNFLLRMPGLNHLAKEELCELYGRPFPVPIKRLDGKDPQPHAPPRAIPGHRVHHTVLCLGEMAAYVPVAGSFCTFAGRYVDDSFGFALTWNYWFNDAVSTAAYLVALQLLLQYWTDLLPWYAVGLVVWVILVLANIINVSLRGARVLAHALPGPADDGWKGMRKRVGTWLCFCEPSAMQHIPFAT